MKPLNNAPLNTKSFLLYQISTDLTFEKLQGLSFSFRGNHAQLTLWMCFASRDFQIYGKSHWCRYCRGFTSVKEKNQLDMETLF